MTELILTQQAGHLVSYPFSHFNPMQSMFIQYIEQEEKNVVIASATCSGKCIKHDSIVLTNDGMLRMDEIGGNVLVGEYGGCIKKYLLH